MKYKFNGSTRKGNFEPGGVYELTESQAANWKNLFSPVSGEPAKTGEKALGTDFGATSTGSPATPVTTPPGEPTKALTPGEIVLRAQAAKNANKTTE